MRFGRVSLGPATTVAPRTFTISRLQRRMESAAVVDIVDSTFAVAADDVAHGVVIDEVA